MMYMGYMHTNRIIIIITIDNDVICIYGVYVYVYDVLAYIVD